MVDKNYEDLVNGIVVKLQQCKYNSFCEYISDLAPTFSKLIIFYLNKSCFYFESNKHKDVSKYLYDILYEYSSNPGKLHRPLTCLAAYMLCHNNNDMIYDVLPVASAIENFQTAALIHDDIADNGQLRRGKPCLHKVYGNGLAINCGDFGLSMVIGSVFQELKSVNCSDSKILNIINKLIFMEYMTIEGQAMDLGWARDNRFDITEQDYFTMATKKSAYYSASVPCVLGAICANAKDEVINILDIFGQKVGLGFQIQDDLINLIDDGTSAKVKDFRSDITEGKRTLCLCKALELANYSDKNRLLEIVQSHTSDVQCLDEAVNIMLSCGAIDYAKCYSLNVIEKACEVLDKNFESSCWKNLLIDMANWTIKRKL